MNSYLYLLLLICILLCSCQEENIVGPSYSLYSLEIIQPNSNSTVSDSVTIILSSKDSSSLIRTEIFINHEFVKSFQKPPFEYFWYVQCLPDGSQHIIEANAYDKEGNIIKAKPVIVYCYRFMPSYLSAILTSDTTIELRWTDNCSFEDGFEIEYKLNNTNFIQIAYVDSNVTSYIYHSSFSQNDMHYFRVRAKSGSSYSGYSNTALSYIQVQMPTNLNVNFSSDTTSIISWKDNTTFEDSYLVQVKLNNNYITIQQLPANTTSANISYEFWNNVTYTFRVAAVSGYIFSSSAPVSAKYLFYAPNNLSASHILLNSLKITWDNKNNFNTHYKVERKINDLNFSDYKTIYSGQSSFIDDKVDSASRYSYRISAFTRINLSPPSNSIEVACLPLITFNKNIQAPEYLSNFDLSKDESIIAACNDAGYNCKSYLLNCNTGSVIKMFKGSDSLDAVMSHIAINYNNSLLATASYGKYLTFWDIANQTIKKRIYLYYYLEDLVSHHTKNILVTSGWGKVVIWDFQNAEPLNTISSAYRYNSITISNSGNFLAIGGSSDKTKILDIASGNVLKIFNSYGEDAKIRFSKDDNNLLVITRTKFIIININSGTSKEFLIDNYGGLYNLTLHPNGIHLIITTYINEFNRSFVVFNLSKEKIENVIPRSYGGGGIRFISDGDEIFALGDYHFFSKWNFYLYRWQKI